MPPPRVAVGHGARVGAAAAFSGLAPRIVAARRLRAIFERGEVALVDTSRRGTGSSAHD